MFSGFGSGSASSLTRDHKENRMSDKSEPIIIEGDGKTVTITHHSSQKITINSAPGSPFLGLVVKDDDGVEVFRQPDGPKNRMWHVEIK
jgi:hypothetical protein